MNHSKQLKNNKYYSTRISPSGFTIVELMVVVVVLAILGFITIALYDNLATKAYDTSLKSDLDTGLSELALYNKENAEYPDDADEINGGMGFDTSQDNMITYTKKPYGFCMSASNPEAEQTYMVRSINSKIIEGDCASTIELLAGAVSTSGFADGQGSAARFNGIEGMAISPSKDVYVAEFHNNRIRKISPSGEVTTFAGTGGSGCTTGPVATAQIERPHNLVFDNYGTMYVMACSGSRIMKITPEGTVSFLAGGGGSTCSGTGTAVQFYWARGLMIDTAGTLYVGNTEQQRICKVTPTGTASTLAGTTQGYLDATGTAAQFNWPWGGAVTESGTVYVTDTNNRRIREVSPTGVVSTLAGSGASGLDDGTGAAATFYNPRSIAVDPVNGNLYVPDSNVIRVITPTGSVSKLSGGASNQLILVGSSDSKQIAFGKDGILYVAGQYAVYKIIL